ncbi:MAG: hypothetical protein Q8S33_19380 [Myxococcales bacterium]|nr:hypothetical protein [Myxococcales bacterium]MDP3502508.1 hypothetical protein [Myxococcales bacterium]
MAFKAQQVKKGFFDIHGLEDFVERKVHDVMQALGLSGKTPAKAAKKAAPAKKTTAKKVAPVKVEAGDALGSVLTALDGHAKKASLIKAGKQKDQLLRSLIPLYIARNVNAEVSSGVTSKFWAKFGVKYAAPNAAKALREHGGYSKRTKNGNQITPNGVKYVESALKA